MTKPAITHDPHTGQATTGARLETVLLASVGALAVLLGRDVTAALAGADGPLRIAMVILRWAAVLGGGYLLSIVVIGVIIRAFRVPATVRRSVNRVTPPAIRRLLDLSVATGVVLSISAVGATAFPVVAKGVPRPTLAGRPAVVVAVGMVGDPASGQRWPTLPDPPVQSTTTPSSSTSIAAVPTSRSPPITRPFIKPITQPKAEPQTVRLFGPAIPQVGPSSTTQSRSPSVDLENSAPNPESLAPATPTSRSPLRQLHQVRRGESFWSIAEDAALAHNPLADERFIADYWRTLIDANRDVLRDRNQPDLLHPGTTLQLPVLG